MGKTFGGTIKLEGESEYRKALSQINAQVKTNASAMSLLTAEYGKNDDSLEKLKKKDEVLNKNLIDQKEKVSVLEKALAESADTYGETDQKTLKWQQSLNKAKADLANTEREVKQNSESMDKLSKDLDDTSENYDDVTKSAGKAGKKVKESGEDAENSGGGWSKLGGALKTAGKAMIAGTAVAGAAVVGIAKKALDASGELEQNMGGSEAVFKNYAENMQKTSQSAFKDMGLSASDYLATANKMGALFQGSGFGIKESSEMSASAMQRASDVASIMGVDVSAAMEAVSGAAKGNFTMMDNLGVAMNDTTLNAYALEKGLIGSGEKMTQQQKISTAMAMFLDKTSYAAGNYAKENDTLAGSLTTAKGALTNFISGTGSGKDVAAALAQAGKNIASKLKELLPDLITAASDLIKGLVPEIVAMLPVLMPVATNAIITLSTALIDNLPQILQCGIDVVLALVNGVSESLPKLIPTIIKSVVLMAKTLIDNLPKIIESGIKLIFALAKGIINALPDLIKQAPVIIKKLTGAITDNLPEIVSMGITLIIELAKGLIQAIPDLLKSIPAIISALIGGFGDYFSDMVEIGDDIIEGIGQGIANAKDWLIGKIKDLCSSVTTKIKDFFGIHSPSTVMRDEVGQYLALGVGEGFTRGMGKVNEDIKAALPTDYSLGVKTAVNSEITTSYQSTLIGSFREALKDFKANVVLDDRVIGEWVCNKVAQEVFT